ncbi:SHOCT domain-containing protein [Leucobacter sp. HY1910]
MQYLLPFIVLMFLFLSIMAGGESGDYSGVFWASLVLVLALVVSVWMGRGRGPSTSEVENRIASEKKEAKARRRAANVASFFSGFGRRASGPAGAIDSQAATVAQINAISDPDTARALQNLQNLLYTQALTDDEFQAAKDKLLGPSVAVSQTEQIEQLAELHRQGVLGDLEFASAKARVLGI